MCIRDRAKFNADTVKKQMVEDLKGMAFDNDEQLKNYAAKYGFNLSSLYAKARGETEETFDEDFVSEDESTH